MESDSAKNMRRFKKESEFLLATGMAVQLEGYLQYLTHFCDLGFRGPVFIEGIRKKMRDSLPKYMEVDKKTGETRGAHLARVLGDAATLKKMIHEEKEAGNLVRAALIYSISDPLIELNAAGVREFTGSLVKGGNFDSALEVLEAAKAAHEYNALELNPEFEAAISEGYKSILQACTDAGKLDENRWLVYKLHLVLGDKEAAAAIIETASTNSTDMSRIWACITRGDYVGAESELLKLHAPAIVALYFFELVYRGGKIVGKESAGNIVDMARAIGNIPYPLDTFAGSNLLSSAFGLLDIGLILHKSYPDGNPKIEGFDTAKGMDLLLSASIELAFRNNDYDRALHYLHGLEARYPDIYAKCDDSIPTLREAWRARK